MAKMDETARQFISYARHLFSNESYSKAFDMYCLAFEYKDELRSRCEMEFRNVLSKLNELLLVSGDTEEVFINFARAVKNYPDNMYILNDVGKYLYKFGFYHEAWCHFQKALKLDSGYVNPEKNLNSIKNLLVERWHFRMLNDKIRNEAYRCAIQETVVPYKDSVLDLGTGTGLLAIYASKCSPSATTGCDGSEVMTKLAECILQENRIQDVIIVNKMSVDMDYRDIGGKRSLLITEMFDAGLFGEHILQSLYHAREHLITNVAKVVPNKAEFFIIGAKCDHLNLKYQLSLQAKKLLNIPSKNVHIQAYSETYDCEDVHQFKDLKYMTEPQSVLKVDFNDINDIQEKLFSTEPYSINMKVVKDGEVNIMIGWFNLYLTENITITTDPRSETRANAWQQAVFFDNIPQTVTKDQIIDVKFLVNQGKLTMLPLVSGRIMRISPETVRFLNDKVYMNMINKCIGMAYIYLGQMTDISQINIVDLCPFPYFGMLMLKRGAQSLICCAKTDYDKSFFKKVFKVNKIPLSKVNILVGEDWSAEVFRDEKYHAIFCNILELGGDIDVRQRRISQQLQRHLLQGGLFMPSKITIMCQLVNSHWMDINNRVYDENVSGYKMAMHMNKYQVSQNFCLDFSCLEYTPLSEPAVLGTCNIMRLGGLNVPIIENGYANAILCWYNIELLENLGEISTKRANSFIDGTAFLANPPARVAYGKPGNVLRCVDSDGSFKLVIDAEAT